VATLFSILVKENDGMGITEFSRETDMSKGAIHGYLNTLVQVGYAVNEDGTCKLGFQFLDFGSHVR
jgi:DNA-binding IclR family transcriptional regulator